MSIRRQSGNFQFEEDPFSKSVQGIGKIYQEVLLLMKFLQTKPNVKGMNHIYFNFYYTVIKNKNEVVNDKYEINEIDYNNFIDYITPNHYIGKEMIMIF